MLTARANSNENMLDQVPTRCSCSGHISVMLSVLNIFGSLHRKYTLPQFERIKSAVGNSNACPLVKALHSGGTGEVVRAYMYTGALTKYER